MGDNQFATPSDAAIGIPCDVFPLLLRTCLIWYRDITHDRGLTAHRNEIITGSRLRWCCQSSGQHRRRFGWIGAGGGFRLILVPCVAGSALLDLTAPHGAASAMATPWPQADLSMRTLATLWVAA